MESDFFARLAAVSMRRLTVHSLLGLGSAQLSTLLLEKYLLARTKDR